MATADAVTVASATVADFAVACSTVACELAFVASLHASAACSLVAVAKQLQAIAVVPLLLLLAAAATKLN